MEGQIRKIALFEFMLMMYCFNVCYGNGSCRPVRNFKNVMIISNTSELSLVDRFFDQHNCSSSDTHPQSFKQCINHCDHLRGCVGFSHKSNNCSICRIDVASSKHVPIKDRKRYLIDMDHLFLLPTVKDCKHLFDIGYRIDGIYTVNPDGYSEVEVFCELSLSNTDGAGWTVIQRRVDASVDFYRDWDDYERGFGDLRGNFWIGLSNMHNLVSESPTELHVHLESFDNETRYARYSSFSIADSSDKYRLSVSGYSGDAGDSLQIHNQMQFTTRDSDNDIYHINCAVMFEGAWWYKNCHSSNLNGKYYNQAAQAFGQGLIWSAFRGIEESIKHAVMKIRRL